MAKLCRFSEKLKQYTTEKQTSAISIADTPRAHTSTWKKEFNQKEKSKPHLTNHMIQNILHRGHDVFFYWC